MDHLQQHTQMLLRKVFQELRNLFLRLQSLFVGERALPCNPTRPHTGSIQFRSGAVVFKTFENFVGHGVEPIILIIFEIVGERVRSPRSPFVGIVCFKNGGHFFRTSGQQYQDKERPPQNLKTTETKRKEEAREKRGVEGVVLKDGGGCKEQGVEGEAGNGCFSQFMDSANET